MTNAFIYWSDSCQILASIIPEMEIEQMGNNPLADPTGWSGKICCGQCLFMVITWFSQWPMNTNYCSSLHYLFIVDHEQLVWWISDLPVTAIEPINDTPCYLCPDRWVTHLLSWTWRSKCNPSMITKFIMMGSPWLSTMVSQWCIPGCWHTGGMTP